MIEVGARVRVVEGPFWSLYGVPGKVIADAPPPGYDLTVAFPNPNSGATMVRLALHYHEVEEA